MGKAHLSLESQQAKDAATRTLVTVRKMATPISLLMGLAGGAASKGTDRINAQLSPTTTTSGISEKALPEAARKAQKAWLKEEKVEKARD